MSSGKYKARGRYKARREWRKQVAAVLRGHKTPIASRQPQRRQAHSSFGIFSFATLCLCLFAAFGLLGCENAQKIHRGVVSGVITDTAGNPLADAVIEAHRSLFTAVSNEKGRYSFTSLDAGSQRFTVTKEGFKTASLTMTLEAGLVYENVNFQLEPLSGKISCSVFKRELETVSFDVFAGEPMKFTFVYQGEHLPQIRTPPTDLLTDYRFVIKPPVPAIIYSYFVEGITADGRRYLTNTATFTTLPFGDIPGAPPAPDPPSVTQTSNGVKISWSYSGTDPLKGFRIWRGEADSPLSLWQTEDMLYSADTFCLDSDVNPGIITRYAIESVDLDGNVSSRTAELRILPAGALKNSVTWPVAWSPIDLYGDIEVPQNITLTIEPGTVVRVSPNDLSRRGVNPLKCEISVEGRLVVAASGSAPVRFISASSQPTRSDWLGIRLSTPADAFDGSEISGLEIVNAQDGVLLLNGPLNLNGLTARMCETGFHIESASGSSIAHLSFYDCTTGFSAENTANLKAKYITARGGDIGLELRGNRGAFVAGIDIRAVNDTALVVDDTASPTVLGAVLEAARLGMRVRGCSADLRFLTIDAPNGVLIDGADQPILRDNVIVNRRAPNTGVGIEERTSGRSYIYNNIFGFYQATLGCDQSGAPVLNIDPMFVGSSSGEFDYHLRPSSPLLTASQTGGQMGAYGWVELESE